MRTINLEEASAFLGLVELQAGTQYLEKNGKKQGDVSVFASKLEFIMRYGFSGRRN